VLSDREREFIREEQEKSGLPSVIKEAIVLARLLEKDPGEIASIRREVSADVNEEYPKL
jgi:hypothetical protein